jgi:KDO2-lipid IV(A) lauroyltransferase
MSGYAAFFIAMRRNRRGHYTLEVQQISAANEGLDPPVFTQRYAALVEAQIRASPADWTWLHRRWKFERPTPSAVTSSAPSQPSIHST